jgi:acyl-CoA thioesterase
MRVDRLLGIDGDELRVPPGWDNAWGGLYGGYVAAVMVNAIERHTPLGQSFAGAHVTFARPMQATAPARIEVENHHGGASAAAFSGRLRQDDETRAAMVGWTTAHAFDQPTLAAVTFPDVPPPESLTRSTGNPRSPFLVRDFDVRPIPTSSTKAVAMQWMRVTTMELDEGAWPASGLTLVADLIGAAHHKAARITHGTDHGAIALDLSIQISAPALGEWVLGVFETVTLGAGRAVGRGVLFDQHGTIAANLTQQSLVRQLR